jgi:hypothetical protein
MHFLLLWNNDLAHYDSGAVYSCKLRSRRIGSRVPIYLNISKCLFTQSNRLCSTTKNRIDPICAVVQHIHAVRHKFIPYGTNSLNVGQCKYPLNLPQPLLSPAKQQHFAREELELASVKMCPRWKLVSVKEDSENLRGQDFGSPSGPN